MVTVSLEAKQTATPNASKQKIVSVTLTSVKVQRLFINLIFVAFIQSANDHASRVELGENRVVRLGTYGDPAAVPSYVWDQLLSECESHLAYSHQSGFRPDITMQSADTLAQAQAHWAKRARTFRVIDSLDDIDKANEILCPASKEAGRRVQCVKCQLCSGLTSNSKKSIAIVEH